MSHIVREIKKHPPASIRNALYFAGWSTKHIRHQSLNWMLETLKGKFMQTEKYDPKLSQAGFMDLVVGLEAQLETLDSRKILAGMPQTQREAVCQLRASVKNYVDVVEGRSSPFAFGEQIENVKEISDEETHAGPYTHGWKPA